MTKKPPERELAATHWPLRPAGTPCSGAGSQESGDAELAAPDDTSHLPFLLCRVHGSVRPAGSVGLHLGRGPRRQPAAALPGTHLHVNNPGWSRRSQLSSLRRNGPCSFKGWAPGSSSSGLHLPAGPHTHTILLNITLLETPTHTFARHPCTGAMLMPLSFQFQCVRCQEKRPRGKRQRCNVAPRAPRPSPSQETAPPAAGGGVASKTPKYSSRRENPALVSVSGCACSGRFIQGNSGQVHDRGPCVSSVQGPHSTHPSPVIVVAWGPFPPWLP